MLEAIFVLIGWVAVAIIVYAVYYSLELRVFVPDLPPSTQTEPRFLFFYAPWCPWSKKAKQHWDAFVDDLTRFPVTFGGNPIKLELVDGDKQPDEVKKYHVTAYPTFKLVTTDGRDYEMNSVPSVDAFRAFLVKFLGKEEPVKLESRRR